MGDLPLAPGPIRILIAEDQKFVADALLALLSQQPGMEVVGTVGSVVDSIHSVARLEPDVVILESRLSDQSAALVRTIQEDSEARLIFLTHNESENVILAAMEIGAGAVLSMSTAAAEVIHAVRIVAEGGSLISPQAMSSVLNGRRKADHSRDKLTRREREVVSLMSQGTSNREIATKMGISYATVRSHVRNVASKLAAHSKLEVLVKAQRLDLVRDETPGKISFA